MADTDDEDEVPQPCAYGFRCGPCADLGAAVTVTFEMVGAHVPGCRHHAHQVAPVLVAEGTGDLPF